MAFPTETVYGLGADARNAEAVAKIFAAKSRPAGNPLIVHVADASAARWYVRDWPSSAQKLTDAFWPGPLTIILPHNGKLAPAISAGRDSIGLRAPNHPVAWALLQAFGGPLAGPSANRSNHVSPTTAAHVRADLGDRVEMILDGGRCQVGIESTVLDLSTEMPAILRPGAITREAIESHIGKVLQHAGHVDPASSAPAPGMHARHYSPRKPAYRFEPPARAAMLEHLERSGRRVVVLCAAPLSEEDRRRLAPHMEIVEMPMDVPGYSARLYAALRRADAGNAEQIWIEMPPALPEWDAVRDRLSRAAVTAE